MNECKSWKSRKERVISYCLSYLTSAFQLLFPRLCVACGNVLACGERFVCLKCLRELQSPCYGDQKREGRIKNRLDVIHFFWLFSYSGKNNHRHLIYAIKYKSKREVGVWAGRILGMKIGEGHGIDCVVPVPLHPTREKQRGYNQSLMIGMGIAEILKVEVEPNVLERVEYSRSQTELSRRKRASNVAKAFVLKDAERLKGCHVLLVDDVFTSGSTMKACLAELRKIEGAHFSIATLGRVGKF